MAKPKKVNLALIPRKHKGEVHPAYRMLDKLVGAHHPHLAEAEIALVFRRAWKEDKDGKVILGQAKKVSDMEKEFHNHDLAVLLSEEFWESPDVSDAQREALLDHELCHFGVTEDEGGNPKRDERGRIVYRLRRHDIEEFRDIVARHGFYKADLERFAAVVMEKCDKPLLKIAEGQ